MGALFREAVVARDLGLGRTPTAPAMYKTPHPLTSGIDHAAFLQTMAYLLVIGSLLLAWFVRKALSFGRNYVVARRTGYPVVISPVLSYSIAWRVLNLPLNHKFKEWFPEWIFERLDILTYAWEFRRKSTVHDRLGKVFVLVTPDECSLWYKTRREDFAWMLRGSNTNLDS